MLFAAVLLLSFVPFLIIVHALVGRSATTKVIRRFGLTGNAADAASAALAPPGATSGAVNGVGWVLFVLSGVAAAAAIQELYERAFNVERRGIKDTHRRIIWLLFLIACGGLVSWASPTVLALGGPVLLGAIALIGLIAFWWLTMWILLAGRVSWRELFPSAVATATCWLGMSIVFRLTMSDTVVSNYRRYGDVGVVLALMSYLIAVGVVIVLGAILGVVWRQWRARAGAGERPGTSEPSR